MECTNAEVGEKVSHRTLNSRPPPICRGDSQRHLSVALSQVPPSSWRRRASLLRSASLPECRFPELFSRACNCLRTPPESLGKLPVGHRSHRRQLFRGPRPAGGWRSSPSPALSNGQLRPVFCRQRPDVRLAQRLDDVARPPLPALRLCDPGNARRIVRRGLHLCTRLSALYLFRRRTPDRA